MQSCSKCKIVKPYSQFPKDATRLNGVRRVCHTCAADRQREYCGKNRDKIRAYKRTTYSRNKELYSQRASATASKRRGLLMVRGARTRAKQSGLEFDLDQHKHEIQKRVDAGYCELTGIPFNLNGGRTWDTPSLDRVVPEKGYVYSNVRVVCRAINCMLGNWGPEIMENVFSKYSVAMSSKRKRIW